MQTSLDPAISTLTPPTALASSLGFDDGRLLMGAFAGRLTVLRFEPLEVELRALFQGCGVYDLGWRARIAVRGEDRLRWLNGMVTNTVQQLAEGEGNYSFFLNAQGRIQGDAFVYRRAKELLLDTTAEQVKPLMAHLDRFIIMDDVTLEDAGETSSGIGLAGPEVARVLTEAGLDVPTAADSIRFATSEWEGAEITVVALPDLLTPQFQILCPPEQVEKLWQRLEYGDAQKCGIEAVEALRILEGLPRFGVDMGDRDLPQETGQTRALNFNKGCYLGQEIVERIRSRGAVHRALRQFSLTGEVPALPADLTAGGKTVGRLTSAVSVPTVSGPASYALGIIRGEAVISGDPLTYNGGEAAVLDRPPAVVFS